MHILIKSAKENIVFGKLFGGKNNKSKRIDDIEKSVNALIGDVKRKGNVLTFKNSVGKTIISSKLINSYASDGAKGEEVLTVKSILPDQFSRTIGDDKIKVLNTMAGLSALIREERTHHLFLANAVCCNDDEIEAWNAIYKPLIVFSSFSQVELLLATLKNVFGMGEPFDLPKKDEPSYWGTQEFEHAEISLQQANLMANAGRNGLTVEFPFESGGMSAVLGDKTSLLQLQADMPHPVLGNGMFFKLELPIEPDKTKQDNLCAQLNRFEFNATDAPPFFGAWCVNNNSGGLAFVGFWPNVLYRKGNALNVAVWMAGRNKMVRGFFENR